MKFLLTVLASVILALLATWYAIAARVKMLERAPEQATVLVVPGPDGTCVPRILRPVIKAHTGDTIEWRSVELPGCEGKGAFDLVSDPSAADHFAPTLRRGSPAQEKTTQVTHQAVAGTAVSYQVELADGQSQTARVEFF
jgi:hypothetical protein